MLQENDRDLTFFSVSSDVFCFVLMFFYVDGFSGWGQKVKPITVFIECGVKRAFFFHHILLHAALQKIAFFVFKVFDDRR